MYIHIYSFKSQSGLNITKIEANTNSEILNKNIYENLKLSLLNKMMGIKYLMKLISKLKKPIIGHNCALDILILSNQFFTPLPGQCIYIVNIFIYLSC